MRRKLCILVPAHWAVDIGGSQYQASVLIPYLLRHYDVDIAYLATLTDPSFEPSGYRIVQFSDRLGLRRHGAFFDVLRLYRALRAERPDAILQYVGTAHTGIAALYARLHGCTMIARVTNDPSVEPLRTSWWRLHRRVERWFLDFGLRNATLILAQSDYQLRQLAQRFAHSPARVLRNFQPAPPDPGRDKPATRRVVWVANLKPSKNPVAFVHLARRFAAQTDLRFVMVGPAVDESAWTQEQLAAIAATPNVDYLGARSQHEVNTLLQDADLFVNTSHYEGFANTFIQAWMRRLPVVSLYVDPDGLLSQRKLGVVAGSEDVLFERVSQLLQSPDERAALGERGRAYALEHHSENNIDALAKLLGLDPRTSRRRSDGPLEQPLLASSAPSR